MPPHDPDGPSNRYIDIFSRGSDSFTFKISPNASWVTATPSSGTISTNGNGTDQRVRFTVDWASAPSGSSLVSMSVTSSSNYGNYGAPLAILPVHNSAVPTSFSGFVESDRHISIEAEHTSSNTSTNGVSYAIIPGYGRTLSGVTLIPVTAPSQSASSGPAIEYDYYAFNTNNSALLTVYVGTSLNSITSLPLKYAVAIDDATPQVVQPVPDYTLGTLLANWGV